MSARFCGTQTVQSGLKTRQMPKSAFGVDSLPQEGVSLSLHPLNAGRACCVDLAECQQAFIALIYGFRLLYPTDIYIHSNYQAHVI